MGISPGRSSRREDTKIAQDEILGTQPSQDRRPVGSARTTRRPSDGPASNGPGRAFDVAFGYMSDTYCSLLFHCVFSTKERRKLIAEDVRERLWAYIGGITREHGMMALAVGGTEDHVHLLLGLPATKTVSQAMREIKQGSSRWMHETCGVPEFAWQEGYGAFSIGLNQVSATVAYIGGQIFPGFHPGLFSRSPYGRSFRAGRMRRGAPVRSLRFPRSTNARGPGTRHQFRRSARAWVGFSRQSQPTPARQPSLRMSSLETDSR